MTSPLESATRAAVDRFNEAVNRRDLKALRTTVSEDCLFESPGAPDGNRYVGVDMLTVFADVMAIEGEGPFETEEIFVCGDRAVVRWLHTWDHGNGDAGHVRGVDILRVSDGRVCEKLSYVKG
ncbi:MAG: hypothetical protein QOJ00_2497 [Actinomycetota bacterium]